ncbi:hypothetical protein PLANPX_5127 [Lacipirellula parvula]|uniref:Uncharacterized protein n=1 Tax=Lacipirellula parvula TaxID=2650471 RepID=A0A5K7XGI9_9BACT|nr:hypothetical protein PLANPX_5127 [Lacipirellula parvula]
MAHGGRFPSWSSRQFGWEIATCLQAAAARNRGLYRRVRAMRLNFATAARTPPYQSREGLSASNSAVFHKKRGAGRGWLFRKCLKAVKAEGLCGLPMARTRNAQIFSATGGRCAAGSGCTRGARGHYCAVVVPSP